MIIAIPLADGKLAAHFGHCDAFALVEADPNNHTVKGSRRVSAPPHEPGLLPRWLAEQGAHVVLAGGMGGRARALFEAQRITVVTGAPVDTPDALAAAYLAGTLATGPNACDH